MHLGRVKTLLAEEYLKQYQAYIMRRTATFREDGRTVQLNPFDFWNGPTMAMHSSNFDNFGRMFRMNCTLILFTTSFTPKMETGW
jgi:hypothetical protein